MSTTHWLIIERDEDYIAKYGEDPDQPERKFSIECSDPAACPGWIECREDHSDATDEDNDRGLDGDEVMLHGEAHTYRYGYDWCVDFPGCVVIERAFEGDDHLEIARTHGLGRHEIDTDWDDDTCYLIAVSDPAEAAS